MIPGNIKIKMGINNNYEFVIKCAEQIKKLMFHNTVTNFTGQPLFILNTSDLIIISIIILLTRWSWNVFELGE